MSSLISRRIPRVPPGLEYLANTDKIIVVQQIEIFEVLSGFERENSYLIKNNLGQNIYAALEDSDWCPQNCFGNSRSFDIKIFDFTGKEVINIYRPFRCGLLCFQCCCQEVEVHGPFNEVIGYVFQQWSLCSSSFHVQNANRQIVFRIKGPSCWSCYRPNKFKVMSSDGRNEIGVIQRKWGGLLREFFTDADIFVITFPMDLDVRMKAVLLGAYFLIDFIFFESQSEQSRETRRRSYQY